MWISKADYTALVDKSARAETRADWLMMRVNQLELDLGTARHELTGKPQPIPMFKKDATPAVDANDLGETSFEDVGDEVALKFGL